MSTSAVETTSEVIPFSFESNEVRTIRDEKGEPWFVAKDVCDILGLNNVAMAISKLPDNHKGVNPIDTLGGTQKLSVIDEPGLYRLILRSDKPQAEPFMEWVTSEVLPAIRKTGSYNLKKTCNVCNQTLPVEAFGKDSQRGDGLNYTCMACRRARDRIYRENKRDALKKIYGDTGAFDSDKKQKKSHSISDEELAMRMVGVLGTMANAFLGKVSSINDLAERIDRIERRMSF